MVPAGEPTMRRLAVVPLVVYGSIMLSLVTMHIGLERSVCWPDVVVATIGILMLAAAAAIGSRD